MPETVRDIIQTILSQLDESTEHLRQPLLELLAELAQNPQNQAIVQAQLLLLLRPNPQLLDAAKGLLRGQSKGLADILESTRTLAIPPATESAPAEQPTTVTRYTDIACPRRVWAQAPRVTVVVRLTRERSDLSPDAQELAVRTDEPVMVQVVATDYKAPTGIARLS